MSLLRCRTLSGCSLVFLFILSDFSGAFGLFTEHPEYPEISAKGLCLPSALVIQSQSTKCVSELLSDSFCSNLSVLVVFVSERDDLTAVYSQNRTACLFGVILGTVRCVFLVLYVFVDVSSGRLALGVHVSRTADRPCSSGSEMRGKETEIGRGMWPFVSDLCLCLCVSLM